MLFRSVEFLNETYYHSLSYLYDKDEFRLQVIKHKEKIKELFGTETKVFRNTELIYNNELANYIEKMGYDAILAEGADHILGEESPNFLYTPATCSRIKLLLKNYRLSDDIAFRFSNRGWAEWPLTAEKFGRWISEFNGSGEIINLFMDYETFGEHQWEDTGIFDFFRQMPHEVLKHPDNDFLLPSQIAGRYDSKKVIDIHNFISWADIERDLSAWVGNRMQQTAMNELYEAGKLVKSSGDKILLEDWRRLTTSDHAYYMCTKWFSDGDVHKYFNPYDSPYDSYINFINVLNDIIIRLKKIDLKKPFEISERPSQFILNHVS